MADGGSDSTGEEAGAARGRQWFAPVRHLSGTWQALNEWGDDFERRNFDGNFLGAVRSAPQAARVLGGRVGEHASRIGEELGTAAAKLVEEAAGRAPETGIVLGADAPPAAAADGPGGALGAGRAAAAAAVGVGVAVADVVCVAGAAAAAGLSGGADRAEGAAGAAAGAAAEPRPDGADAAPAQAPWPAVALPARLAPSWRGAPRPGQEAAAAAPRPTAAAAAAGTTGLWEETGRLQEELAKEREMRRGRVVAFASLDEASRGLREELLQVRRGLERDGGALQAARARAEAAERSLEALREGHDALLARRAQQEAELRRLAVSNLVAERAAREASRSTSAWAREGPETEALKDAKVALAEVLADMDQAKLEAKREAAELRRCIEAAEAEKARLLQAAEEPYQAPASFRASVWRLLKVAARGEGADLSASPPATDDEALRRRTSAAEQSS